METVVLKTFDNYFSANIILTRLQDAGIRCFLTGEYTSTIYPIFNNNASGGIGLSVHFNDEVAARLLLSEFEEEYLHAAVCPVCGRSEFTQVVRPVHHSATKLPLMILLMDHLTSFLKKIFKDTNVEMEAIYQCGHCKYESATLPVNTLEHN
jgi:hypothetical protein